MAACLSFSIGRHTGRFPEDSARERLILDGRDRQGASGKKARVAMAGTRAARARGAGRRPRPHPDCPSSEPSSAVRSQPGHRPLRAAASGSRPGGRVLAPSRSDADASAPSPPRRSNLSSPSITLPATPGDPRDTQRTAARGHRGRSVGRAQREARFLALCGVFFFSFFLLNIWIVG